MEDDKYDAEEEDGMASDEKSYVVPDEQDVSDEYIVEEEVVPV